jgi:hypothetical protein
MTFSSDWPGRSPFGSSTMRGYVRARPPARRTFDHRQTLSFLSALFLGHLRNDRQFRKLSARDRRTGISTHQDDQDSNDSGHYGLFVCSLPLCLLEGYEGFLSSHLAEVVYGVQRLGKQSVSGHASNEDSCHRFGRQRSAGMNNFKLIKARDKFRVRIADKPQELVGRQRGGSAS